jgi:hypothetical protein
MKKILILLCAIPLLLSAAEPIDRHPEGDAGYTQKIREYATAPEFLTDLVDHLPASADVPTPEKFHGYVAGAPDKLTYAADVHRYMRALEAASPRCLRPTRCGATIHRETTRSCSTPFFNTRTWARDGPRRPGSDHSGFSGTMKTGGFG